MKKITGYILTAILNFIAGFCFLFASIFQKQTVPKYGFLVASICLLISGTGFLYTYLKNRKVNSIERESGTVKKKMLFVIAMIVIIALAIVAWFYGYHNRKSNDNLPSLTSIACMDEAEVNEIVCGYRREQLADVWGVPNESSSMEDVWVIEDDITLTVNYHNNNDKAVMCDLSNQ